MGAIEELIDSLETIALNPNMAVKKSMNDTGREAIGCFPIYTPEEIIYAAGFLPVGMWGGKTEIRLADMYLPGFCCSIMRSNMELGLKGSYDCLKAVVLPTFCDTLKCICENWKASIPKIPIIPIVYPQNRILIAGKEYLTAEFKRVKTEIERIAGADVSESDLHRSFDMYEEYRATMRNFVEVAKKYPNTVNTRTRHLIIKASYFMDKSEYTITVRKITDELRKIPEEKSKGIKVVATGLIGEPIEILDIFVENNINIVADDFAQESRQFRVPATSEGNVWEKMATRISEQRGDTFFYEEQKSKGQMLIKMAQENKAAGIVVFMMKFCDPEEFDFPIIKEEIDSAGIPLLYIEIDQQMDSFEQVRTRVQSFTEMLK